MLDGSDFTGADCERADFSHATLYNVTFDETWLGQTKFDHAQFEGVSFKGACLSNYNPAGWNPATFLEVELGDSILGPTADFSNAWLMGVDLSTVRGLENASLDGAIARGRDMFPAGFEPLDAGVYLVDEMERDAAVDALEHWLNTFKYATRPRLPGDKVVTPESQIQEFRERMESRRSTDMQVDEGESSA
jgi:hypothetical protein